MERSGSFNILYERWRTVSVVNLHNIITYTRIIFEIGFHYTGKSIRVPLSNISSYKRCYTFASVIFFYKVGNTLTNKFFRNPKFPLVLLVKFWGDGRLSVVKTTIFQ